LYDEITQVYLINANIFEYSEKPNKIYTYGGFTLTEIYHGGGERINLNKVKNQVLISFNQKIYTFGEGSFREFLDFTGTDYAGAIWGNSKIDFFTWNYGHSIGHYNGTNLINIYKADSSGWSSVTGIAFPGEAFFICRMLDSQETTVIHGRLE
jgi:hypothetical protein